MHIVYALIETFFVSEPEQYNYNRTFRKKNFWFISRIHLGYELI